MTDDEKRQRILEAIKVHKELYGWSPIIVEIAKRANLPIEQTGAIFKIMLEAGIINKYNTGHRAYRIEETES